MTSSLAKKKTSRYLKFLLKLGLSILALYFVSRKIDLSQSLELLTESFSIYLLLAILLFNLSQVVSAFRLNISFRVSGIQLSHKTNIILYYVGMFYNLFLPGGIGGDGYKVFFINKRSGRRVKDLVYILLADRLFGLSALLILGALLFFLADTPGNLSLIPPALLLLWILYNAVLFLLIKRFTDLSKAFIRLQLYSLTVQLLQCTMAYVLLVNFNINDNLLIYLSLFLLSSIAAVLPISIGGVGARELVFIYASGYLPVNEEIAVAFTLLFFLITALSSFAGIFLKLPKPVTQNIKPVESVESH